MKQKEVFSWERAISDTGGLFEGSLKLNSKKAFTSEIVKLTQCSVQHYYLHVLENKLFTQPFREKKKTCWNYFCSYGPEVQCASSELKWKKMVVPI